MDTFSERFNEFLTGAFNSILKSEEEIIKHTNNVSITISELHLVDAVGKSQKESKNTVSEIADMLNITNSSVTIAVNKLIVKGLLRKVKNELDKRSVYVVLTDEGEKIYSHHDDFHKKMVEYVSSQLSDDEKNVLLYGVEKISTFFQEDSFRKFLNEQKNNSLD